MKDEKKEEQPGKGIKYDDGKLPMGLLSHTALKEIARVLQFGAKKYSSHNWRGGIYWSRLIDATYRHLGAFNSGEDRDPETGISHLAHAACDLIFLLEYEQTHQELDDRYKKDSK